MLRIAAGLLGTLSLRIGLVKYVLGEAQIEEGHVLFQIGGQNLMPEARKPTWKFVQLMVSTALLIWLMVPGAKAQGSQSDVNSVAQSSPKLKPDVPRLDTAPAPPKATSAPLQGKVQHDSKLTNTKHGLFGSAGQLFGRAGQGTMGRSRNQLPGKITGDTLSSEVESGIGIIGVRFVMFMGRSPVINRVFPLTPAAANGMLIDDVIVAVDGVPTAGLSKEEVYDMIVGKPGTPVTLSIQRNGDFRVFNLVRMDLNDISDPFVRRDYLRSM